MTSPQKTLSSMLSAALETNATFTPRELVLVKTIFNDKNVGDKVNELFAKILADGKIDIYDVPNLVLVLTEIYKTYIVEKRIENVNVIHIIELTLDCIIDCDLVPIPEFEKKIIKNVIETSLKLLETNLPTIKKGCFSLRHCMCSWCGW